MVVDNNKSVPSIMSRDVSQFSQFGSPGPFVGEKLFDEQSHTHTHIVGPIKLSTKRRGKAFKGRRGFLNAF